jgi:Transcriptional regulatory protein, C terminal
VLVVEDLKLDRVEHRAERAGRRIELTSKEFSLLEYLMRNAGRQVSRAMIIEHVWNLTFDTTTNVVDVYIFGRFQKVESLQFRGDCGVNVREKLSSTWLNCAFDSRMRIHMPALGLHCIQQLDRHSLFSVECLPSAGWLVT